MTGVQTCALPISAAGLPHAQRRPGRARPHGLDKLWIPGDRPAPEKADRPDGLLARRQVHDGLGQHDGERQTDLIILTHDCVEQKMNRAMADMQQLPTVLGPIIRIRKEELN